MAWYDIRERGSEWGLWFTYFSAKYLGYTFTRTFCHFIIAYFFLFAGSARRNILKFQKVALNSSDYKKAYMTFFHFAESVVDRLFILMGKTSIFTCRTHNAELMDSIIASGRGGVMLSAHVGPVEASRIHAESRGYRISVLIHSAISPKLYRILRKANPDIERSMINIEPDSIDYIFDVKERIESGQFVAMLGDRTWQTGKTLSMPFFGKDVDFPLGPYKIALSLGCPILLIFVIKSGKYVFDVNIEELYRGRDNAREAPSVTERELLQRFVQRLEYYAGTAPTQWYNFYDFWAKRSKERM